MQFEIVMLSCEVRRLCRKNISFSSMDNAVVCSATDELEETFVARQRTRSTRDFATPNCRKIAVNTCPLPKYFADIPHRKFPIYKLHE